MDNKGKGNAAFKAGLMDDAVKYYTRALQKDRRDFVCMANRSAAHLKLGSAQAALDDAEKCIRIKPKYAKGHARKGAALHVMKRYSEEVQAYKTGLGYCPDDKTLLQGLTTSKKSRTHNSKASQAARKTKATRQAANSRGAKAKKSQNVSQFVIQTKKNLELQMAALQAQLDMVNELEKMSIEEKADLLFSLMDKDGGGTIDAKELAEAFRKQNEGLSFSGSIEKSIEMIAIYDEDGDAELDRDEFEQFLNRMVSDLQTTFDEFCEFLVYQILFADDTADGEDVDINELNQEVKQRGELLDSLSDPRMKDLFVLFDGDGNNYVSFKEVACGLYHLTNNMEESAKATTNLLLMLDKDDARKLDYPKFAKLILAIAATSNASFDEVADDLTLALTTNGGRIDSKALKLLTIADEAYAMAREKEKSLKKSIKHIDPFSYQRVLKLFDLWDADGSGTLDFDELFDGLRRYQAASNNGHSRESVEKGVKMLMEGDVDGDQQLDRDEFAVSIMKYAEAVGTDLHELIDFICVIAGLS
ncbi:Stress-induced-phosphoprotein 1 [Seminavis robusta]|uniref:Stress-induced-phosphoprotein 1 n=1 Tax=Seminavis robusta TaxID=568900 RepID=A0A9N8EAW2_9STRA|nr:Stress-induced-phosphoprotein 1 [Seminavis robusta]|eukprot:Sro741_g195780.1 Stress-induced-phosphoprotein 1 (531) ;mRNA; f:39847-41532